MPMAENRKTPSGLSDQEAIADFESVLITAIRVSQGAANAPTNRVGEMASQLLTQNVITGLTIASLIQPAPRAGIPGVIENFTVTDLPSLSILTRGVVETYLVLFYLAVQSVRADEKEFRLLWWDWHEVNERISSLDWIGSKARKLETFRKSRSELRPKIAKHPCFPRLPDKLRTEFEKKRPPSDAVLMSKAKIAEASGVHLNQFRVVYKGLSQYAHAQPVAVSTLLGLSASSPEIETHFRHVARHATSYLLFSVRDFITVFPQGRSFTDEKFWRLVAIWTGVHKADLASVQW